MAIDKTVITKYPKTKRTDTSTTNYKRATLINLSENSINMVKGTTKTIDVICNETPSIKSIDNINIITASITGNTGKSKAILTVNGINDGVTNIRLSTNQSLTTYNTICTIPVIVRPGYRFGYKIRKAIPDPYDNVEYMYDAVDMLPAKMDFINDEFSYGSWRDVWFVKDNKPLMLQNDGTIKYYLDPNNYNYIEGTNTASDVASTTFEGNAMAQMPLVWFNRYEDDNYYYEIASNVEYDSDYKAYAHSIVYNGSYYTKPYFYYSMFEGSGNKSGIRSLSGKSCVGSLTVTNELAGCKANGNNWYSTTWMQHEYLRTLSVLISKSLDSQRVFGHGNVRSGDSSNLIKTGTLIDKGQFYGVSATSKAVKIFHVENAWGNMRERIAGLMRDADKTTQYYYIKLAPDNTSPDDNYGYRISDTVGYLRTNISSSGLTDGTFITNMSCSEYGMLPIAGAKGTDSTYFCSHVSNTANTLVYAQVGNGVNNASMSSGMFTFHIYAVHSKTSAYYGTRLSYLPGMVY